MASAVYTDSQQASALTHLDRRAEWRFFWRDGIRYVSMLSGRSNRLYVVRADAGSCSCPRNEKMWQRCAHMLAVEIDATEDELREAGWSPIPPAELVAVAAFEERIRSEGAPKPRPSYDSLMDHHLVDAF